MKQSEFNYVVELDDGNYGVFNTYKNSLVILNSNEYNQLQNLNTAEDHMIDSFKELNLIVEDGVDERSIVEADTMKYSNDDRVMLRILTTLDCNADCIYCYEKRNHMKMSKETADKVVDFLRRITTDKLHIEWFGGEPLYNHEIISYICNKLYEYDINFSSSMVTNAILCTPDIIKELPYWKVTRMQVTVDGAYLDYDEVKRVKTGTFLKVIENIKNIINSKIDVTIRLNYYNDNILVLKKLINYMADEIGPHEYLHYYAYPIFELCNSDKEFDPNIVDKIFEIQEHLIINGLETPEHIYNMRYKGMGCFATHKYGYTIGPDGTLHGCSHTVNQSVGDVVNGDNENRKLFAASIHEKCKTCKIYPVCKGGCKVAELGYEKINQCNLYKNRFDEFIKKMIHFKTNKPIKEVI